jgi:hypothetical protein
MTAPEVTQALAGWEERLRALGAPGVGHLRPGLTSVQAEAIAAEFGVRLSVDAAAIWMWHDGDRAALSERWGEPSIVPTGMFYDLRTSLQQSLDLHDLLWDDDEDEPELVEVMFRREWVTFIASQHPLVIDCTDPEAPTSITAPFRSDAGITQTPHLSVPDRVRWWHWALDHDAWGVAPDGSWTWDLDRFPGPVLGMEHKEVLG